MGNAMKGTFAWVLENLTTPGKQLLLAQTAIAASMSLTNQPGASPATGQHLHLAITGNTAVGSVTVAGKDVNGNNISETISNIPIYNAANSQHPNVNDFEYCTQNVYASVNANGITTTGLTNGFITIYGGQAAKILIPSEVDIDPPIYEEYDPKEHRGLVYEATNIQQGVQKVDWSVKQSLYPENSLIIPHAFASASPTVTTIPASPTVLKAATAVSTGPFGLTTAPTGPGMLLQVVVTSAGAAGTIVVVGTNPAGQSITETIVASGNGTFYSSNTFASVGASGISFTGLTGGSAAFNGVVAYDYVFLPAEQVYSLAGEDYTGTDTANITLMTPTDFELSQDVKKAVELTVKGFAQDWQAIGDRTTANMTGSRGVQLGQPLDKPLTGWQSQIFIDPVPGSGGTVGATQFMDLNTLKLAVKTPAEPEYNATNSQLMTGVYRNQIGGTIDLSINFKNLVQAENFRTNGKMILVIKYLGPVLGTNAGSLVQKAWIFYVAAKYKAVKRKRAGKVTADIQGTIEYEPSLGYGLKIEVICTQPPTLPN